MSQDPTCFFCGRKNPTKRKGVWKWCGECDAERILQRAKEHWRRIKQGGEI